MAISAPERIATVDHGTVPVNDLGACHRFYTRLFGAEPKSIVNLSVQRQRAGRAGIFFLRVAGHEFPLFLQDDFLPPAQRYGEGPRYGWEVAPDGLAAARQALEQEGVAYRSPLAYPAEHPIVESVFLQDPSGTPLEICVRRQPVADRQPLQAPIPVLRLHHVALDTADLARARDFYEKALGFQEIHRGASPEDGLPQATFATRSGQLLLLTEVPRMSERATRRYHSDLHFALITDLADYPGIVDALTARNSPLLPDYVAGARQVEEGPSTSATQTATTCSSWRSGACSRPRSPRAANAPRRPHAPSTRGRARTGIAGWRLRDGPVGGTAPGGQHCARRNRRGSPDGGSPEHGGPIAVAADRLPGGHRALRAAVRGQGGGILPQARRRRGDQLRGHQRRPRGPH
jgi:catechol 2,3-dioxygenase-like lactoylglutathione lyase family enzyme